MRQLEWYARWQSRDVDEIYLRGFDCGIKAAELLEQIGSDDGDGDGGDAWVRAAASHGEAGALAALQAVALPEYVEAACRKLRALLSPDAPRAPACFLLYSGGWTSRAPAADGRGEAAARAAVETFRTAREARLSLEARRAEEDAAERAERQARLLVPVVASGSWDKTVRLCDVASGRVVRTLDKGHTDRVLSVAFSPDGAAPWRAIPA